MGKAIQLEHCLRWSRCVGGYDVVYTWLGRHWYIEFFYDVRATWELALLVRHMPDDEELLWAIEGRIEEIELFYEKYGEDDAYEEEE